MTVGNKRAILTLNDGVFGIFVFGVVVVIVLLGIAQGIFRTVGNKDGHLARLAAGDGGGILTRESQVAQHQRHAGRTLFHLDGAVRAAARDGVGTAVGDGERRAVDLIARGPILCGDAAIRKCQRDRVRDIGLRRLLRAASGERQCQLRRAEERQ